jgi:hypothetical protein
MIYMYREVKLQDMYVYVTNTNNAIFRLYSFLPTLGDANKNLAEKVKT